MMWTVIIVWAELFDDNYEAPRLGHNGGWFESKIDCEKSLVDFAMLVDDHKIAEDPTGIVVKFPHIGGDGYLRCTQLLLPSG